MSRLFLIFSIILLAITLRAETLSATLGASSSTNVVITSEAIEEPAWERQVVMKDNATGEIFNDDGKVGSAAESAAALAIAIHAAEISDAAHEAVLDSLSVLDDAASHAATNAIGLALAVYPEISRTNLTAYVVKTETDGTNDTQYVWYNRRLDLEPSRFLVYESFGYAATNKVTWLNWTNTVTVVKNGRTWEGCHVCTVARPSWAVGSACLDLPNDRLGGASGFDFGDMLLTMDGEPLYTGFVTNGITGAVLYFDNGFCLGNPDED